VQNFILLLDAFLCRKCWHPTVPDPTREFVDNPWKWPDPTTLLKLLAKICTWFPPLSFVANAVADADIIVDDCFFWGEDLAVRVGVVAVTVATRKPGFHASTDGNLRH